MVGEEGVGQELCAEEVEVDGDRKDFGFGMKVGGISHLEAARDGAEGFVLNNLEGSEVGGADVGVPDGGCVTNDGFYECVVGEGEGLLLVTPGSAREGFEDAQAF